MLNDFARFDKTKTPGLCCTFNLIVRRDDALHSHHPQLPGLVAHHSRGGEPGLMGLWLTVPFALLLNRRWADRAVQLMMLAGALEWVLTIQTFVEIRQMIGLPYLRMVLILGGVALFTALSGLLLETRGRRNRLPANDPVAAGLGAFLFTAALLVPVQIFAPPEVCWPSDSCSPPAGGRPFSWPSMPAG